DTIDDRQDSSQVLKKLGVDSPAILSDFYLNVIYNTFYRRVRFSDVYSDNLCRRKFLLDSFGDGICERFHKVIFFCGNDSMNERIACFIVNRLFQTIMRNSRGKVRSNFYIYFELPAEILFVGVYAMVRVKRRIFYSDNILGVHRNKEALRI